MICYLYRYILWREVDEKIFENLILGGGNSLKPSSSACFGQYSNVKFGARKGAFTLAEVLITLGIIGVVAALTLPSLIQKYQDQVLENQLKKTYSTISQGIQKAMADDGVSNFYDTELFQACKSPEQKSNACAQMVKKYFNVVAVKTDRREYYVDVVQFHDDYVNDKLVFHGRDKSKRSFHPEWVLGRSDYSDRFMLSDGSEFTFGAWVDQYGKNGAHIDIDTNGERGPNTEGFDTFGLGVGENGRVTCSNFYFCEVQENNWKFPW